MPKMFKVKVAFIEKWFRSKTGEQWYKLHFKLGEDSAWVPSSVLYEVGAEVTLRISRDKEGRAKVSLAL